MKRKNGAVNAIEQSSIESELAILRFVLCLLCAIPGGLCMTYFSLFSFNFSLRLPTGLKVRLFLATIETSCPVDPEIP